MAAIFKFIQVWLPPLSNVYLALLATLLLCLLSHPYPEVFMTFPRHSYCSKLPFSFPFSVSTLKKGCNFPVLIIVTTALFQQLLILVLESGCQRFKILHCFNIPLSMMFIVHNLWCTHVVSLSTSKLFVGCCNLLEKKPWNSVFILPLLLQGISIIRKFVFRLRESAGL